jgi:hypothetical protein
MFNKEQCWNSYKVVQYVIDTIDDFDISDVIRSRFSYGSIVKCHKFMDRVVYNEKLQDEAVTHKSILAAVPLE